MTETIFLHAADALNTTLHQMRDGRILGSETRKIPMGPWRIDITVKVESDIIQKDRISFWLEIEHLRAYMVCSDYHSLEDTSRTKSSIWLVVLDREKFEIQKAFGFSKNGLFKERFAELRPMTKDVFNWDEQDEWTHMVAKKVH